MRQLRRFLGKTGENQKWVEKSKTGRWREKMCVRFDEGRADDITYRLFR